MVMGMEKEHMQKNIKNPTRLYDVENVDGKAKGSNAYTVLIQNTQNVEHEFFIDIIDNDKIKIERPSHPFKIKPGVKTKKTLVLYTTETLADSARHDSILEVKLKAYALDAKATIIADRDIRFTYPRADMIRKKMGTE